MHPLADAPTDVLFGLIALHNDLITPAMAAAALGTRHRDRAVSEILIAQGALSGRQRELVESLSSEYIERHGGDAQAGLVAFLTAGPGRERLDRVGDAELTKTFESLVPTVVPGTAGDPRCTAITAGDGPRFRVLRPHAKGGIGEVFVALDAELNREVALKRIQECRADDPGSRARFLLEAEVTGGLEHPGIVPVYALGREPGGRPYYAMRFIRGESFKQAIAAFHEAADGPSADPTARSLGLRQLLRRFVDVCNAVEYAHRRGVLHRDLKPGNIMVGPYGETLVVDWGLARALATASTSTVPGPAERERPIGVLSDGGSSETIPGSVLGTPGYMSPEQAAGDMDRLGPSSDVYSLGATLASLLTGLPPFSQHEPHDVLRAVCAGEFTPPRQVDRSIDPALEAVCLKAMALDPEDRYPSPKALAEDLERWMADEAVSAHRETWAERLARWTRRHRARAQAGAAALLVVAIIASVAALLVDRARRAEKAARGQVTQSLLAERSAKAAADASLKQATVNLGLARQAVEEYFTRVSQDTLLKRQNAPSLRDLRELRKDLLDVALRYYQTFVAQHQDDPALQVELAKAYGRVGEITSEIGSKPRALEAHQQAMAIWAKLAEAAPRDVKTQSGLGVSHFHIGVVQRQLGRGALALASYDQALATWERVAAEHPEVAIQQELGKTLTARGSVLSDLGRATDSMESHSRALAVYQRLAAKDPANPAYQDQIAGAYNNVATIQIKLRHVAEALAAFDRAREIWERVAAANPSVPHYQQNLALAFRNIGLLKSETNHPTEALAAYERAREIRSRLVAENPTVSQFQFELADMLLFIGVHFRTTGHPDKALVTYAEAGTILTRLVADNPSVTSFQQKLVAIWVNSANIHNGSGRYDEALTGYERGRAIQARMVADHHELTELRHTLGMLDNDYGKSLFNAGRLDAALVATERGRDVLEAVAAENPQVPDYRRNLASSHNIIGVVHFFSGRLDQALPALERARAIRARLATDHPAVLQYQLDLAESLSDIGSLQARAERLPEALESYEQARDRLVKLADSDPSQATVHRNLAAVHNYIASVRSVIGPRDKARASAERARALLEPLPRPLAEELYELALSHALGAELDSPDPIPTTAEDRARREAHADRAVQLLRRAIEGGYRNLAELENEAAWRPLRRRPDFQILRFDLAFPADPFAR